MQRSTVYLPGELKAALAEMASTTEAELIRKPIATLTAGSRGATDPAVVRERRSDLRPHRRTVGPRFRARLIVLDASVLRGLGGKPFRLLPER